MKSFASGMSSSKAGAPNASKSHLGEDLGVRPTWGSRTFVVLGAVSLAAVSTALIAIRYEISFDGGPSAKVNNEPLKELSDHRPGHADLDSAVVARPSISLDGSDDDWGRLERKTRPRQELGAGYSARHSISDEQSTQKNQALDNVEVKARRVSSVREHSRSTSDRTRNYVPEQGRRVAAAEEDGGAQELGPRIAQLGPVPEIVPARRSIRSSSRPAEDAKKNTLNQHVDGSNPSNRLVEETVTDGGALKAGVAVPASVGDAARLNASGILAPQVSALSSTQSSAVSRDGLHEHVTEVLADKSAGSLLRPAELRSRGHVVEHLKSDANGQVARHDAESSSRPLAEDAVQLDIGPLASPRRVERQYAEFGKAASPSNFAWGADRPTELSADSSLRSNRPAAIEAETELVDSVSASDTEARFSKGKIPALDPSQASTAQIGNANGSAAVRTRRDLGSVRTSDGPSSGVSGEATVRSDSPRLNGIDGSAIARSDLPEVGFPGALSANANAIHKVDRAAQFGLNSTIGSEDWVSFSDGTSSSEAKPNLVDGLRDVTLSIDGSHPGRKVHTGNNSQAEHQDLDRANSTEVLGALSLRDDHQGNVSIRLADLIALLEDKMDRPLFVWLKSADAASKYVTFDTLRAAGIDAVFDASANHVVLSVRNSEAK